MSSLEISSADWIQALEASACHTAFADHFYVQTMADLSDGEPTLLGDPGNGWALTGLTRTRGPLRELFLPLFTPFSGLALADLSEASAHAGTDSLGALGAALETRYQRVRLHLPPTLSDPRPLQWRGWQVSPLFTYQIPVAADWEAGMSSASRRLLRKESDRFECRTDPASVPEIVSLLLASYDRQDRYLSVDPNRLMEAIRTLMRPQTEGIHASRRCFAECVVARDDSGAAAAGIALLHAPAASYYWVAGSAPGPAMTVLLGFVLQVLAERGVPLLDMVGANTPTIAEFKRRLGARLVPYHAATWESGPIARGLGALQRLRNR